MKKRYVILSQSSVQAVSVDISPTNITPEVEDTQYWQETSEEQFTPLEIDEFRNLNVSEPQRGQLCEILLSFPQVLATQPGRTNLVQHLISVEDVTAIKQKPYRILIHRESKFSWSLIECCKQV